MRTRAESVTETVRVTIRVFGDAIWQQSPRDFGLPLAAISRGGLRRRPSLPAAAIPFATSFGRHLLLELGEPLGLGFGFGFCFSLLGLLLFLFLFLAVVASSSKRTSAGLGGALKAIAQLATGELVDNPEVSALSVAGEESALPDTLAAGATLTIEPTVSDPYGEGGRVVTYFASAGSFDPWRTNEAGPSTYTAPAEAEEVTLTVIVRDPGGGVGWTQHTLSVTEAP